VVARVEFHLQRCSPCLEAYDFEAELRKVIVAKCEESVPGDLRQRILERFPEGVREELLALATRCA